MGSGFAYGSVLSCMQKWFPHKRGFASGLGASAFGLSTVVFSPVASTLLDAVDCIEGNGPGGGDVRHMGMTLCSRSPYALDEQAALLMGLRGDMPPTVRAARRRGLMQEPAVLAGDALVPASPPIRQPDAIVGKERFLSGNGLFHRFFGRGRALPRVDAAKCIGCGRCAESCPMHLIHIENRKAVMTSKGCISCFCCQEMCPAHAIEARRKGLFS